MMKNNNATSPFCFDTARVAKVVDTTEAKVEKEAIAMTTGVAVIPVRPIALMNGIVLIVEITEVKVAREARRIMGAGKEITTIIGQATPILGRPTALMNGIVGLVVDLIVEITEAKVAREARRIMGAGKEITTIIGQATPILGRPTALMNGIVGLVVDLIVEITEAKVAREARRIMGAAKASTNIGQVIPGRRPTALTITTGIITVEKVVDSMEVKVDFMEEREVKGARVEKVSGIPHTEQSEYLRISLLVGPHLILIISLLVGPHLIPIIILLPTIMVVMIATIMRAGVITESIGRIAIILKKIICAIITMRDSISENIVEKVAVTVPNIRNPVHLQESHPENQQESRQGSPQGNLQESQLGSRPEAQ